MHDWYGYTGAYLLYCHGRAIRRVVPHAQCQHLLEMVRQQLPHRRGKWVTEETFAAAMIAPLAIRALEKSPPEMTAFASVGQVARLFAGRSIEQVALNFVNGAIASAYEATDVERLAARITQAFEKGELLVLPRDAERLHAPATLRDLPGMVAFMLARAQAQRKAFNTYLRRGTPPVMTLDRVVMATKSRRIPRTWAHEACILQEGDAQ